MKSLLNYLAITIIWIITQSNLHSQCPQPIAGNVSRCGPGTATLTATTLASNVTHRWYLASSGGYPISGVVSVYTGGYPGVTNYTASFATSKTFYVSSYNPSTGCESSPRVPITVTVTNPVVPAVTLSSSPTITGSDGNGPYLSVCSGTSVILTANPANGGSNPTYRWKKNALTIPGAVSATYTPPSIVNGDIFSVEMTSNATCLATSTAVSLNMRMIVSPNPTQPLVTQPFYLAYNTAATLTASGASSGEGYKWYTSSTGGTALASTVTPNLTVNTGYYVIKYNTTTYCQSSPRVLFAININRLPVVNAGTDQTLDYLFNDVKLSGSATDPDGSIKSVLWTQTSGPAVPVPNSPALAVNPGNLKSGNYVFRLTATDTLNFTAFDEISVTINPIQPEFNYNFVKVTEPQYGKKTLAPADSCLINYQYFDGLGRPLQTVSVGASPTAGYDMVQVFDYDQFGRQAVKYLPFAVNNNGGYVSGAIAKDKNFYKNLFPGDTLYATTLFEASPLNRPLKQGAPGTDWQPKSTGTDHAVHFNYQANGSDIRCWDVTGTAANSTAFTVAANYMPGKLTVNATTDENGHTSKDFIDLQGQVIMKEAPGGLRTYYIYDDLNLLRCIVPPMANETIDDKYCYYYRYDERRRLVEKKIPGAGPVYMVYDKRDRLVLSQDGNMRPGNQWMATLYENNFNRPIMTGIYVNSGSQTTLQTAINGNISYIPANALDTLSQTFYDNYSQRPTGYAFQAGYQTSENTAIKGQISFTKTRYVNAIGKKDWLVTVNYYDNKYRVIQTIAGNHLGGKDIISNQYDFVGKIMQTKQVHSASGITDSIMKQFVYDHTGRLLETKMKLNNGTYKNILKNNYNRLGQLEKKETHKISDNSFLFRTAFRYNIRGWMTTMADTSANTMLFKLDLGYNSGSNPQYNGNISWMGWNSSKLVSQRNYSFTYDAVNRLTVASFTGTPGENYGTDYLYDTNGNISHLNRNGYTGGATYPVIDDLAYTYNGNQLIAVNDGYTLTDPIKMENGFKEKVQANAIVTDINTHEYRYDANGNLTKDDNKGIENISYNPLNLPDSIGYANGSYILYLYDAAGIKLQQKVYNSETYSLDETNYIGNFVYHGTDSLKFILSDDGRLVPNRSGFDYEYNIKDHLGNTRVVLADKDNNGVPEIMQETHYDPFGFALVGQNYQNPLQRAVNKYLYNGKELQIELGLDWYDYGARFYDAVIGRWHGIDPMSENRYWLSPYQYAQNNPIMRIDPNGMLDGWIEDDKGNVSWDANTNSQKEFNKNYEGKDGYSYVSDADNANSYTLPNGDGKLVVNQWEGVDVEDGVGSVQINLEFVPSEEVGKTGWFQTYDSNLPDVTENNLYSALPNEKSEERLDGPMIVDKTDINQAVSFDNPASNVLKDQPIRSLNAGAKTDVKWNAQSSMVINGQKSVSVGWGFTINSQRSGTSNPPTILKSTTEFHNNAIKNLKP